MPRLDPTRVQKPKKPRADVSRVVPATGETVAEFVSRRYDKIARMMGPFMPSRGILEFSVSPVADVELDGLLKGLVRAQNVAERAQRVKAAQANARASRIEKRLDELLETEPEKREWTHTEINEILDNAPPSRKEDAERLFRETVGDLTKRALQPLGGFGGSPLEQASRFLEEQYHGFSQPVGAAALSLGSYLRAPFLLAAGEPAGIIHPDEAYNRLVEFGPGRAFAAEAGIKPGSLPFKLISGTTDFFFRFGDPLAVGGRAAQAAKIARTIPGVAGTGRGVVQRFVFDALSKTPEEIVASRTGQRGVRTLWKTLDKQRAAGAVNKVAFLDRWPELSLYVDDLARAKNIDEVSEILTEGMYGRLTGVGKTNMAARLSGVDKDLAGLATKGEIGTDAYKALSRQRDALRKALDSGLSTSVIRQAPSSTVWGAVRQAVKRPDVETSVGRTVQFFTDSKWSRLGLPARGRIPNRPISLDPFSKTEAAKEVSDVGKLLGLSRKEIDEAANTFLEATSREEAYEAYKVMLAKGKTNLGRIGPELTQIFEAPGNSVYWVDRTGQVIKSWFRRKILKEGEEEIGEVLYNQPIFDNQIIQGLPLPDLRGIVEARAFGGRIRSALRGLGTGPISRTIAGSGPLSLGGRFTAEAWVGLNRIISGFTSVFWVPAVLARLGWPLRVVGEEQVRLAAVGVHALEDNPLTFFAKALAHPIQAARGRLEELPEAAMARYGKLITRELAGRAGIIRQGEKGYYEALRDSINFLRDSRIARYRVRHTREETLEWLKNGEGREFLDNHLPILRATGKSVDDWMSTIDEAIDATVGKSERLKAAVGSGYLETQAGGKVRTTSRGMIDELRRANAGELPLGAIPNGETWRYSDPSMWRRGTALVMDYLGSKPTNVLSRSKAFRYFHATEKARLKTLGIADDVAEREAKRYGIRQVGAILYDAGERTATDVMIRNLAPFFPAWKEVLSRWIGVIPAQMGAGVGHAYLARKVQLAWDSLKGAGVIVRNRDGDWEIRAKGMDAAFGWWLGIPGLKTGVPVRNINMLGNWPGLGPVPSAGLSGIVSGSEGLTKFFDSIYGYGVDASLGPTWASRALRSVGIDPPWEVFNRKHQDALFAMSVVDVARLRFKDLERIAQMPVDTDAQRQAQQKAARDFWDSAEGQARGVLFKRAVMGFVLPAQPRLYWPNQEEADRLRETAEKAGSSAFREALDRHPELGVFFTPKTERISGELSRNESRDAFFAALKREEVRPFGEKWVEIAIGDINYNAIRREQREKLSDLGTTGADWLRSADEWLKINRDAQHKTELLREANPTWDKWWQEKIARAARREGRPLPDLEEHLAMRGTSAFATVFREFSDDLAEQGVDVSAIERGLAAIREHFQVDRFYSDEEFPPGPERDIAQWFNTVHEPYWKNYLDIRKRSVDKEAATAEERDRGFLELQKLKNEFGDEIPAHVTKIYVRHENEGTRRTISRLAGQAIARWNKAAGAQVVELTDKAPRADERFVVTIDVYPGERIPRALGLFYSGVEGALHPRIIIDRAAIDLDTIEHEIGHALGAGHQTIKFEDESIGKDRLSADIKKAADEVRDKAKLHRGVLINGIEYPTPEEFSYLKRPPAEREGMKQRWAMNKVEWLSRFQRSQLNLPTSDDAVTFWERVQETEISMKAFIRSQGWTPTQKEATNVREAFRDWRESAAKAAGLSDELALSQAPPYHRLRAMKVVGGDVWERITQVADGAWAILIEAEKGPRSKIGVQVQRAFYRWLTGVRQVSDEANTFLNDLQAQTRYKSVDTGFYPYIFFNEGF